MDCSPYSVLSIEDNLTSKLSYPDVPLFVLILLNYCQGGGYPAGSRVGERDGGDGRGGGWRWARLRGRDGRCMLFLLLFFCGWLSSYVVLIVYVIEPELSGHGGRVQEEPSCWEAKEEEGTEGCLLFCFYYFLFYFHDSLTKVYLMTHVIQMTKSESECQISQGLRAHIHLWLLSVYKVDCRLDFSGRSSSTSQSVTPSVASTCEKQPLQWTRKFHL